MHVPRLYLPVILTEGAILELEDQSAHHLIHVLRLRAGAAVKVFDGQGHEHDATVHELHRARVTVALGAAVTSVPEPRLSITLAQGIPRGDRMDLILQKAVELGVSTVQPLWTQRSQARAGGERLEKRLRHWRGVVISACEQCGRATLPELAPPLDYGAWLSGENGAGCRLLLDPRAGVSLGEILAPRNPVHLLVGPEGGFSDGELKLAAAAGFNALRLGPRVLRTETATLAMLAALQALWGDLR